MLLLLAFAFLAGVATIISPCCLPVLPALLSTSIGGRGRPLGIVAGFVVTFALATLVVAAAAQAQAGPTAWLRVVAIVALGVAGLALLLPGFGRRLELLLAPLSRTTRAPRAGGFFAGLPLGAALGLVWAPCVGPIMASVIALAVTRGISSAGAAVTLAYGIGAAMPMLAIGYGAQRLAGARRRLGLRSELLRRAFGGLTLLAALALLTGQDSRVQRLLPTAPSAALTGFEQGAPAQRQLAALAGEPPAASTAVATAATPSLTTPATQPTAATSLPTTQAATAVAATAAAATPASPRSAAAASTQRAVAAPVLPAPVAAPARPATAPLAAAPAPALPDLGAAPELTGLTEWINSAPLSLQDLHGKVVIVDFWTFDCYNCQNTEPYVKALYARYAGQGLQILGIHAPELAFERVPANVRSAVKERAITWPVALDPDFKTWSAFHNSVWPAFYFIDARGHLRFTHFGEGNYDGNEQVVRQLLAEAKAPPN